MAEKEAKVSAEEKAVDEKQLLKEAEEREKERKAEEKKAKEEEKEAAEAEKSEQPKKQIRKKPAHGKKYREVAKLIEKGKEYSVEEALELVTKTSTAKFDATAEVHVKINDKEKNIRGTVVMPGGTAKERRVLGVTEDNVGEVIEKAKSGKIDFDILVAEAKMMPKLAVVAKILGPKGLMPSPKAGTVVDDVEKAVAELKGGRVEYRADKYNIVHMPLGKISFGAERIKQNYEALMLHLPAKRVESIFMTATMGPSIKVVRK
ncbi:MAG: 50S ribosomal protein L1 [bacterium ADurb.Bin400]|nr:MAG: 50S ribosomal protein L1 [bacterium ADurb.Bin400]